MKRYAIFLILLLALLTTSCVSEEVKNEYVRAKVDRIEAETAALEQKRQQDQLSWEAAEARRAESEKESRQTRRVLAYIIATGAVVGGLIWAISSAHKIWTKNRLMILRAERRAERAVHKAKVEAFEKRRTLIRAEAKRLEQERLLLKIRARDNGHSRQTVASITQEINCSDPGHSR
jgi:hypothetical protein